MKDRFFKAIIQKTTDTHSIMVCVVPNDLICDGLPTIYELQAHLMAPTIYTGTYPQIKLNPETIKDRPDLIGMGISGIVTEAEWYTKDVHKEDIFGIHLNK